MCRESRATTVFDLGTTCSTSVARGWTFRVTCTFVFLLWVGACGGLQAQNFGGPTTSPMPINTAPGLQNGPGFPSDPAASVATPLTKLDPVPTTPYSAPQAPNSLSLGSPVFDPYNSGSNPGVFQSAIPNQQAIPPGAAFPGSSSLGSWFGGLTGNSASFPAGTPPGMYAAPAGNPYAAAPPSYPSSIYPQSSPPVLFPGGAGGGGMPGAYYNPFAQLSMPAATKFFQGPRVQYGWLGGGDGATDLGVNELETSLAFAFPNFLWSGQPIYVLPSFSLDLWDGPSGIAADLPGQVYEAFLDTGWQTDPNNILGLETGLRVGVFTDFDTMNEDSLRIMGKALGKFRLTPRATLKAGVMYIDRNEIKILPAGGLLWQPTPYSRWDIYFPEPKISRYFRTIGTQDVWGYVAGEFGGGSWTIQRANGTEDSVDVNDMRLLFGLEWGRSDLIRAGRRTGFLEAGWVFNREVIYDRNPADNFDPDSTFIVRVGIGY